MLFDDKFVEDLKDNPIKKTIEACGIAIEALNLEYSSEWSEFDYPVLMETYALLVEIIEAEILKIQIFIPVIESCASSNDCLIILNFIREVESKAQAENSKFSLTSLRNRFKSSLSNSFHYEFSQGDVDRIQELLNQLRKLVAESDKFEPDHQQRLLKRLEKLQSEVHKKISDLDKFWGLVGDAGVAVGKFGNDAKPIFDRIKEISQIVWQAQTRAEELPSGMEMPLLSNETNRDQKEN